MSMDIRIENRNVIRTQNNFFIYSLASNNPTTLIINASKCKTEKIVNNKSDCVIKYPLPLQRVLGEV